MSASQWRKAIAPLASRQLYCARAISLIRQATASDIKRDRITVAADPNILQSYAYVPEWGRAAVKLAEKRTELAMFEDVPFLGHAFTTADLHRCIEGRTGRPIKITQFAW